MFKWKERKGLGVPGCIRNKYKGCCNELPHAVWLKLQKLTDRSWKAKIKVARLVLFEGCEERI